MARITGRALYLEVETDEWQGEVQSYELTSEDISNPTFGQVMDGEAKRTLALEVQQDMGSGTAYRYLWDHAGESGIDVVLAPYGNDTPSVAQPHHPLVCTLPRQPSLGGEATYDGAPLTASVELTVDSVGALITSAE